MPSAAHAPIFLLYAGAAYYALWVIGEQNDIAPGAIKLCTSGVVRSVYTQVPAIDRLLGLLVAFFHSATSLPQTAPFQTFFGSILAVPLVIILVESSRANNPALIRWSALAAGAVCQLAGAAIAVPVWMALYSLLNIPKAATGSSKRIRSITPAFTASFFGLALLMSNEGGFLTKDQAFIGSALWQAFPIWVSILQVVIPTFLPDNGTTAASAKRTTQTFFALLTTVVYWKALYTLHEVAETTGSTYGEVIWSIVNIPLHPKSHSEATHLFLLFDCAVVTVTTLTFVVSGAKSKAKMLLAITAMAPIVGPGAAFAWGWRSWDVEGGVAKGKKRA